MSKRHLFQLEGLKKELIYILGKRPDEFGLVPDREGFIKIKELIQALHEEEGLGFVRESHINELMMHDGGDFFDIEGNRIRAKAISWELELEDPVYDLPKLLYTSVRRRAYPVIMEKGIFYRDDSHIILSPSKDMAFRIGRRKDPNPVILEIIAYDAMEKGSQFFSFGQLYLCSWISKDVILGPPLDKEELEEKKKKKEKRDTEREKIERAFSAGTFVLKEPREKKGKGKKKKGWKEKARKARKRKDMDLF